MELFGDDVTIFWYENLLRFLTEKKKLFWTNKKFVYLIFIPKYCNIIPKYRTKGHEQVLNVGYSTIFWENAESLVGTSAYHSNVKK